MTDQALLLDASRRAARYIDSLETRTVFPTPDAVDNLSQFTEPMPQNGCSAGTVLAQLDTLGSPATVASNGGNYYGFVIGATLPIADAAERLSLAWDQCASSEVNSPAAHAIETVAAQWVLEALQLPSECAVGFGTSATASGISCLATARRHLLDTLGWDIQQHGIDQAPPLRVLVSKHVHVTILKALRVLGFGDRQIEYLDCDKHGRITPEALSNVDNHCIVCLQAGEVNTGEFDPFITLIQQAKNRGAWVHIDGAFGLWARTSPSRRYLTEGIENADSWTTDGHKWLNTPYDGAIAICRHTHSFSATLSGNASYAHGADNAQKNLTLEFSRRARGIPIWAALKFLGTSGIADMVDRHCEYAKRIAESLERQGYHILNRVVLNQVLVRAKTDALTERVLLAAQNSGETWFGASVWEGRPAFRISVSSWRTQASHIEKLIDLMQGITRDTTST